MALLIFIAEDNDTILESLRETLEELADARVVGSSPTAEGSIDWLTSHSSDWHLVIIDLFLLSGTGLDVLREIHPATHEAIVLTNYATPDIRRACRALGANAVFDKSTEIDEMIAYCAASALRAERSSAS